MLVTRGRAEEASFWWSVLVLVRRCLHHSVLSQTGCLPMHVLRLILVGTWVGRLSEQTSLKTTDSNFINPLHWRWARLDFASFHPCPTLVGLLHSWGVGIILSYLVHPSLLPDQRSWGSGQSRMSFYRTVPLVSIPGCSFLCFLL